jgi:hypothetical protein
MPNRVTRLQRLYHKLLQLCFIPKGTIYRHWSGFDRPRYEGIFSHYSVDGSIVHFDLVTQTAEEVWQGRGIIHTNRPRWLDIVHTKSPKSFHEDAVYAFSPDGYVSRNTTVILGPSDRWRKGRKGAVELVLNLEERFVEFAWWEVIIKLLLVRGSANDIDYGVKKPSFPLIGRSKLQYTPTPRAQYQDEMA